MFNSRLKEERLAAKLTQTDLAEVAGVKMRTVQDWERGLSTPTIKQLAALADREIDVVYILTGVRLSKDACRNIALMMKVTAMQDPLGESDASHLAVEAAINIAKAAEQAKIEKERVRLKFESLNDGDRAAIENMIDVLLAKKLNKEPK